MDQTTEEILSELAESLGSPGIDHKKYQVLCDASTGLCRAKLRVGIQRAYPVSRELLGGSLAHLASQPVKVGDETAPYFGFGSVAEVCDINRKKKSVTFIASTGSPDRMGDVIEQDGWQLRNYRKNPVHLFAHNSTGLPIGTGLPIRVDGDRLIQTVTYKPVTGFDLPQVIFELVDAGVLRGISVGFLPHEFSFIEGGNGRRFTKVELLETSTVPIPANPEALVSSKSFDVEQALGSLLAGDHKPSEQEIWRELAAGGQESSDDIWKELITWTDNFDPEIDKVVNGIRQGKEAAILVLCTAIAAELELESESKRCLLKAGLKTPGRERMKALAEIFLRRRGTEGGQNIARTLFGEIFCRECYGGQKEKRCSCGCRRFLCKQCCELDETTALILKELARSV